MIGRKTKRTRSLRTQKLEPDEEKLVDDIEKYGCHVVQVSAGNGFPGWSFTIGLEELLGVPELIVIGLKDEVAHSLLNECAHRLQEGIRLGPRRRERGLLSDVECEFRPVEKRWLKQTMGYAAWFYGGDDFQALQCVYPDLANRFPWEEGFSKDWRSRQPLLFPHSLPPNVEQDFWAANDPESSLHDWKFNDPPHTGVFTTKQVMNGQDSVTRAFHDTVDGAWQFLGPGDARREDFAYVCFHHIIDKDSTIGGLADLPLGWCAWRETVTAPWIREVAPPESESEPFNVVG